MLQFWRKLIGGEGAATSVEYAVILSLILMAAIVAITTFGNTTSTLWGNMDTEITTYTTGS